MSIKTRARFQTVIKTNDLSKDQIQQIVDILNENHMTFWLMLGHIVVAYSSTDKIDAVDKIHNIINASIPRENTVYNRITFSFAPSEDRDINDRSMFIFGSDILQDRKAGFYSSVIPMSQLIYTSSLQDAECEHDDETGVDFYLRKHGARSGIVAGITLLKVDLRSGTATFKIHLFYVRLDVSVAKYYRVDELSKTHEYVISQNNGQCITKILEPILAILSTKSATKYIGHLCEAADWAASELLNQIIDSTPEEDLANIPESLTTTDQIVHSVAADTNMVTFTNTNILLNGNRYPNASTYSSDRREDHGEAQSFSGKKKFTKGGTTALKKGPRKPKKILMSAISVTMRNGTVYDVEIPVRQQDVIAELIARNISLSINEEVTPADFKINFRPTNAPVDMTTEQKEFAQQEAVKKSDAVSEQERNDIEAVVPGALSDLEEDEFADIQPQHEDAPATDVVESESINEFPAAEANAEPIAIGSEFTV